MKKKLVLCFQVIYLNADRLEGLYKKKKYKEKISSELQGYKKKKEIICLQYFYNIFITNLKWQIVTGCYC